MLQFTDDPVGDLLGLGRDVEHVEVDDAAHDSVPPQIKLKLITFHLIIKIFKAFKDLFFIRILRPRNKNTLHLVHVDPLLQLLLGLGGGVLVLLPDRLINDIR